MIKKMAYLAFQNVKKNKKYFFIVASIIFFLSVFYNTTYIYQVSYKNVEKEYNSEQYGEWYVREDFIDWNNSQKKIDKLKNIFETKYREKEQYKDFQYCFVYKQNSYRNGIVGFDNIGYFDEDYMKLCHVQLKEGIMPHNSKNIAISTKYQKEHHLNINDDVVVHINNKLVKCKVVGIYQNSQDNMFDVCVSHQDAIKNYPTLYSNCSLFGNKQECYDELDNKRNAIVESYSEIQLIETINPYGYDHNTLNYSIQLTYEQVITLFNVLLIVSVLLICLNKTSYRKRMREFALYRGIGMTTYQLAFMMLCEIFFMMMFAIVLGMVLSLFVSYILMLNVESKLGYFAYVLDIRQMILNGFVLFFMILFVNLLPIYQSVNMALSGAFGTKKFSYFKVRQNHLKPVKIFHFASKELLGNYFVIGCLVIFLSFFSSMAVVNQFGREPIFEGELHYILDIQSQGQIPQPLLDKKYNVNKYRVTETIIMDNVYEYPSKIKKVIAIDDEKIFNKYFVSSVKDEKVDQFIGNGYVYVPDCIKNFPLERDNEDTYIMLSDKYEVKQMEVFYTDEGSRFEDRLMYEDNSLLGFYGKDQDDSDVSCGEYIKGFLKSNQVLYNDIPIDTIHYFPSDAIYMNKDEFKNLFHENDYEEAYVFFDNKAEVDRYLAELIQYPDISIKYINEHQIYADIIGNYHQLFIPTSVVIAVMIATFIIFMYMNLSDIENHKHDYFLQRLLGMTDLDILKKQLMKVFIIFISMAGLSLVFTIMQTVYYMQKFQLLSFIILLIIEFIMLVLDYIFPMLYVLKDKELIKIEERE